jgi:hypothetical protein
MSATTLPVVEAIGVKKTYMLGKIPVEALRGVNYGLKWEISSLSLDLLEAVNQPCSTSSAHWINPLRHSAHRRS